MSEPVITVEGLGKRYELAHAARHDTLRDTLVQGVKGLFRGNADRASTEEFWALRDVSFTVNRGDVVGIIGRNGAGKSTLLKILSRITEPTTGSARIRGRVASLLEVGTGFHPELSGRENIFLNGAILGMSREEIRRKFDEIVTFAEIERFLDTPVKHYSSGMYVRLAFAVAAHLEPEILIIDEVLAVGDAQFQQKCLGRMESISRGEGRTVLFVSHNLAAVRQLCPSALLLSAGKLAGAGPTPSILDLYQSRLPVRASYVRASASPEASAVITEVSLHDRHGQLAESFNSGDQPQVTIKLDVRKPLPSVQLALRLSTLEGIAVCTTTSSDAARSLDRLAVGRHVFRASLPDWLAPGPYTLKLALCEPQREVFDAVDDEIRFEVTPTNSIAAALHDDRRGIAAPLLAWEHQPPA